MNKMTFKLLAILLAVVMVSCSSGDVKENNSGDKAVASRQVKELSTLTPLKTNKP